jgi:hypothetical protein
MARAFRLQSPMHGRSNEVGGKRCFSLHRMVVEKNLSENGCLSWQAGCS